MSKLQQTYIVRKITVHARLLCDRYPVVPSLLRWITICLLIGSLIGSAAAGFLYSLNWATTMRESNRWLIALLPLGGLLIGLLYHYYGKAAAAGTSLLLDTIREPRQIIPFRMAPFVYIGTIVTHLLGGSAGREGTALQMAGSIADQFSKPFRLSVSDRKMLIIAAVAGGFGAVFGTPWAGAVFALEFSLAGRLRYNALLPALATAIVADTVARLWQAPHTHYHIQTIPAVSLATIGYAVLAGLFFGTVAAAFGKTMRRTSAFFTSVISYPPLRPFVGGILVAGIVAAIGTTKYIGLGIPTIVQSFSEPLPAYDFALKMLLTVLTLAAGFKGGEVTPLFFIGAALGNALGYFIPLPLGLLAGMGFVAVFAGATNTPIACTVMALELFGAECGVYVAIACVVAYFLSGNNSIYGNQVVGKAKYQRYSNSLIKRWNER